MDDTATEVQDAVTTPAPRPAPTGPVIGRYELGRAIASGPAGAVHEAYDPELDRPVALKVIDSRRTGLSTSQAHRRLARDARALARLSHPNIVAVYDAGEHDDQVFIAMELVAGTSLAEWCRTEPRPSWRAILRAYLDAARGIAAAHSAGLVHRDLEPENLLIGDDGRVRVGDFGIAALADREPADGEPVGPQADQYSFCLALHESLHGHHPFSASGEAGALDDLRDRRPDLRLTPPGDPAIPSWVHRVVRRGLSPDPMDRWPSMDAVIAALEDDPARRRRRRLAVASLGLGLVAILGLAVAGWLREPADRALTCQPGAAAFDEIWDPAAAAELTRAYVDLEDAHAEASLGRLIDVLDRYGDEWRAMRIAACEATHVHDTQSTETLDLQMHCLDRRRDRLRALASAVTRDRQRVRGGPGPGELLDSAIEAAFGLPPVADCADLDTLRAAVPPPDDPRIREQVRSLTGRLDQATTAREIGRYQRALEIAEAVLDETGGVPASPDRSAAIAVVDPRVDHPPLRARALLEVGRARVALGAVESGVAALHAALPVAAAAKDDVIIARTWSAILVAISSDLGRPIDAMRWRPAAELAAERVDDVRTRAVVWLALGEAWRNHGDYQAALSRELAALAILPEVGRPDADLPALANAENSVGLSLHVLGRYREARDHYQRAIAHAETSLGPDHPELGRYVENLGIALDVLARHDEARAAYERAARIYRRTLRPDHPLIASQLASLGMLAVRQRQTDEGIDYLERAVEALAARVDPEHPALAHLYSNLGYALIVADQQFERARSLYDRAIAIQEKRLPAGHPDTLLTRLNRTGMLMPMRHFERAGGELAKSLEAHEQALGAHHPRVARVLDELAVVALKGDRYDEGIGYVQRSAAINERALGPDHPRVGLSLELWGALLAKAGDLAGSGRYSARSLAILEKRGDEKPIRLANALNSQGVLHYQLGELDDARAMLVRAREIGAGVLGADSGFVGDVCLNLASIEAASGRYREAIALIDRARAIHQELPGGPAEGQILRGIGERARSMYELGEGERALAQLERALERQTALFGPAHHRVGVWSYALADILARLGQRGRARALYRRSLDVLEAIHGEGSFRTVIPALGLAELDLAAGQVERAAAASERALAICDKSGHRCWWRSAFVLARASWLAGGDRAEARRLARRARDAYAGAGHRVRQAEVERWLAEHELP